VSDIRTEIYHNYKTMIYNYFYRSTLNYDITEDLTQDTFLKAFKYFTSFRGESSMKTWLFIIARNILITHIKNSPSLSEDISEQNVSDKENQYSSLDEKLLIKKVLNKLSEEERSLIVLRDVNDLTYIEIAKIMNFTEGKVKIGLHRARKKFKEYYLKECGGEVK